jgi:hypothetical protein
VCVVHVAVVCCCCGRRNFCVHVIRTAHAPRKINW